jgi:hypothetical protein
MPITAAALVPHPPLLVSGVGRGADDDLEQLRSACRSAVATTLDLVDTLVVVGPAESWGAAAPGTVGSFRPYGPQVEVVLPGTDPPGELSAGNWLDRAALPSKQLAELPLSLAVAAWLLEQEAKVRALPEVAAFTIPASLDVAAASAAGRTLAAAKGAGPASPGATATGGAATGAPGTTRASTEGTSARGTSTGGTGTGRASPGATATGGAAAGAAGTRGTSTATTGAARVGLLVMGDLSARRTAKAPATFHPAAEDFDRRIGDAIRKAELDRLLDIDAALAAELRVGGTAALWLLAGALESTSPLRGEVRYEAAPFGVGYLVGVVESR